MVWILAKNVAGSGFDKIKQIWGFGGRAGKSLLSRAFAKAARVLRASAIPLPRLSGTWPVSP